MIDIYSPGPQAYLALALCHGPRPTQPQPYVMAVDVDPTKDTVQVWYIDYANKEGIPASRLKLMDQRFMSLELQCVKCQLHNQGAQVVRQHVERPVPSHHRERGADGRVCQAYSAPALCHGPRPTQPQPNVMAPGLLSPSAISWPQTSSPMAQSLPDPAQ